MRNTVIVNLFAGPNAGKSGTADGLVSLLKCNHISCEKVCEVAKDHIWSNNLVALECQPYVTGEQVYRQYRVLGKVDYVVTDSPILLGLEYGKFGKTDSWANQVNEWFDAFTNINIYLLRAGNNEDFCEEGRIYTAEENLELDQAILSNLNNSGRKYYTVQIRQDNSHIEEIYGIITHEMQSI